MLGKIGLTLLVIIAVIIVAMAMRRIKTAAAGAAKRAAADKPPKRIEAEDLVRCGNCGVYHAKGDQHVCSR